MGENIASYNNSNTKSYFSRNKKFFVFSLIFILFLSAALILVQQNYEKNTYAFSIGGKNYSKTQIRKLVKTPQSIDNKIDYSRSAYNYYKYIYLFNKLNLQYSNFDLNSILSQEADVYKTSTSNNWVQLESKYLLIKNYINIDNLQGKQKQGFYCDFYPIDSNTLASSNSTILKNSVSNLIKYISFDNSGNYNIEYILRNDSDHIADLASLKNGYCFNFGFNSQSWKLDVQTPDIISSINTYKSSGLSKILTGNNLGSPSYYYFFNLIENTDTKPISSVYFEKQLNILWTKYYGI
jgi:hypothetical protein